MHKGIKAGRREGHSTIEARKTHIAAESDKSRFESDAPQGLETKVSSTLSDLPTAVWCGFANGWMEMNSMRFRSSATTCLLPAALASMLSPVDESQVYSAGDPKL